MPIGTPLTSAVIMFSGHSLMDQPIPDYVELLAQSDSVFIDWQRQHINGSTINGRSWRGPTPPITWTGYSQGANRVGSDLNLIDHFRNVSAVNGKVTSDPYTHLVICERHDLLNTVEWEVTIPVLMSYYNLIRQGSPGCLGYFYSTWLDFNLPDLPNWVTYTQDTDSATAAVASRINASLAYQGRSDFLQLLPAAGALGELVNLATTGTVPGITQGSVADTMSLLFSDNVHPTNIGKYYLACVVYGTVYRRDPRGLAYPTDYVTSTQAASLQEVAWDYLNVVFGDPPHTGPQYTASAAQAEIVDYVPIYADFFPGPINVPGIQSYFAGTDSDMWFDPPASETIWLPSPPTAPSERNNSAIFSMCF